MQGCKPRASSVDGEYSAKARTPANLRRPIQGMARQNDSGARTISVGVGVAARRTKPSCREAMQRREGLRRHPTSRYQTKNGYQHGQKERAELATDTLIHSLILGMVQFNHNRAISATVRFQFVSGFNRH